MAEQATPEHTPTPKKSPRQRRSDGADGARPLIVPPPGAILARPANSPDKPNAALKEAPPKENESYDPQHPARGRVQIVDAERGLVSEVGPDGAPRFKIAICGFASSTRRYMPVHDPTWSIWGLNQLYRHIPRADRWFDIHYNWNDEVVPGTDHFGWIRDCGIPVYMLHRHDDLPTSVRYPIDILLNHFRADYFTSSIAYMLALATLEIDMAVARDLRETIRRMPKAAVADEVLGLTRAAYERYSIGIFGVDLVVQEEYFWQKACAEFWIGSASMRGIQIVIPPESALCKQQYRYGYDPEPQSLLKLTDITSAQQGAIKERDDIFKKLCMLEGFIQANEQWRQVIELRSRGTVI